MRKTLASKNNLTFCSLLIFVATLSSGYVLAQSALETDEMAGKCALYAVMRGKDNAAYAAFAMASNQSRAEQFLSQGLAEMKKLKDNGEWEAYKDAFIGEHDRICKKLGIRVSDY